MIANVSAHRRANAFAQSLEEQELQGATAEQSEPSAEHAERNRLLALASGLGELPAPELDPEVKIVQRARLIAAMEAQFAEGAAQVPEQRTGKGAHRASPLSKLRPRSRWSKGLAAGGLTVGVAAGAFGGVAAASNNALPGDSLYGLKRGMEDFKLGMADGDSDRGQIYLDQASTRMQEARRLLERGRLGDLDHESVGEVRKALSGMHFDASEGHRLLHEAYERDGSLNPIRALSSFTTSHREGWHQLRERLPLQLTDVRDQVSSVFDAIDEEVGPLRSLLPATTDQHGTTDRHGAPRHAAPDPTDHPTPSSQPTASDSGPGEAEHRPSPSSSADEREDGGLLGGTGLLDPPAKEHGGSPTPSHGEAGKEGKPGTKPDITIPPLLPGLLPGLGINGDDGK
ncbi:DUF5667 domain-containing protein [Streptomyces sp. NPDC050617]|uniref:DUF5667 domain-containing protein n=1 Tax=Streptomyces sp. NPDC050617 TaxID=3154628 RepID=UPI00343C49C3